MTALDDLKASVATLIANAAQEISVVSAKISDLLAHQGSATDTDLQNLKAQIDTVAANLLNETNTVSPPG